VRLTGIAVDFTLREDLPGVEVVVRVSAVDRTGPEMEAMTAAAAAALTIYDMCKAMDRGMVIEAVELVEKSGGKSGSGRARPAEARQGDRCCATHRGARGADRRGPGWPAGEERRRTSGGGRLRAALGGAGEGLRVGPGRRSQRWRGEPARVYARGHGCGRLECSVGARGREPGAGGATEALPEVR
jgi:hypothetical protein